MESTEICLGGNKYRIVGENGTGVSTTEDFSVPTTDITVGEKLDRVVDILAGGRAGYSFTKMTIPPNQNSFEVNLGMNATQMHVRCDADVSIKLNSRSGDDITLKIDDFPFSMSELRPNESINRLYFTTETSGAVIQVITIGYT